MDRAYTVGKLEKGEWQKYGSRLLSVLTKEFNTARDWSIVPSALVLFGAVILIRGGVKREDVDKMISDYLAEVEKLVAESVN